MISQILQGTPTFVYALFVALLALGLSQLRARRVALRRVALTALAMGGLSLFGVYSAFPHQALALPAWLLTAALSLALWMRHAPATGARFDAWQNHLIVPGSKVPLALIMAIFFTKYAVGVTLAMQPALAEHLAFAMSISVAYGAFGGIFLARAALLLRLTQTNDDPGQQPMWV